MMPTSLTAKTDAAPDAISSSTSIDPQAICNHIPEALNSLGSPTLADTEKAVLGGIMCLGFAPIEKGRELKREDFSVTGYGAIFWWLKENQGGKFRAGYEHAMTLSESLKGHGMLRPVSQGNEFVVDSMGKALSWGDGTLNHEKERMIDLADQTRRKDITTKHSSGRCSDAELEATLKTINDRSDRGASFAPQFADFDKLINEGFKVEKPTLCRYSHDRFLLYPGRINEIHGEPGVGKTNINLAICAEVMQDGGKVLFLDPEDHAGAIGARFIALGGRPEDLTNRFYYLQYPSPDEIAPLQVWAKTEGIAVVVVDGLAEALAAENVGEDNPTELLPWFKTRLRPFCEGGAAVLVSDHVAKSTESRGRWARGSGCKLGRYDGVSYEIRLKGRYAPGTDGFVRLVVSKDRNGGVGPVSMEVADLHFTDAGEGQTDVEFRPPSDTGKEKWSPTIIMEKISRFIEGAGPCTKRLLRGLGNSSHVDQAITELVRLGHLGIEQKGAAHMHVIKKAYREGADKGAQ